jgi:threonylcarbamoyladenosine tRNA methylthiotransferase MtaB
LPWTRIHAFPYSERPGTKAALAAGAVPRAARARRAQRLRELSLERYRAAADSQVGQIKQTLLIRARAGGGAQGLTRDYWPVRVAGAGEGLMRRLGQEIDIEIVGFAQDATTRMEGCLLGRAAKELVENPTRQKNAEVTKGERE